MKKIKYVIFDWDGTLADTYPTLNKAYAYAFEKIGQPSLTSEEIKKITSTVQNKDVLSYIYGDQAKEAGKFFYDYIEKNHIANLQEIKGAREVLDFCFQNNLNVFLLTNKTRKYLLEELEHLDFTKYFSKIIAAGDFKKDKPDPMVCEALFGKNAPDKDEMLVIGDGLSDVKVAQFFGTKIVVYDGRNMRNIQGDYHIDNLVKAIDIIQGKIL